MSQRRSYPRTPYERHGQVNHRATGRLPQSLERFVPSSVESRHFDDRDKTTRRVREEVEPNCVFVVTKRKGFGTTGNKESSPMSIHGANMLLNQFTNDKFMRYRVNVYLKKKG